MEEQKENNKLNKIKEDKERKISVFSMLIVPVLVIVCSEWGSLIPDWIVFVILSAACIICGIWIITFVCIILLSIFIKKFPDIVRMTDNADNALASAEWFSNEPWEPFPAAISMICYTFRMHVTDEWAVFLITLASVTIIFGMCVWIRNIRASHE